MTHSKIESPKEHFLSGSPSRAPAPTMASPQEYRTISPLEELHLMDAVMADVTLPMTARVVMYLIVRWTNGDKAHRFKGYSWAGREKLAGSIGRVSRTTITTATKKLEEKGWIIIQRRANKTNLIRPNWSKALAGRAKASGVRLKVEPEDEKTARAEEQHSVLHEGQKSGSYRAELDSADQDRAFHSRRCASGTSHASSNERANVANRQRQTDHTGKIYQQSKAEADKALEDLRSMAFREEWDDPTITLSAGSARAEAVHFHRLLRSGISATRLVRAAELFLQSWPDHQCPSLAGFLAKYASDCTEPDSAWYVPDRPANPSNETRHFLSHKRGILNLGRVSGESPAVADEVSPRKFENNSPKFEKKAGAA